MADPPWHRVVRQGRLPHLVALFALLAAFVCPAAPLWVLNPVSQAASNGQEVITSSSTPLFLNSPEYRLSSAPGVFNVTGVLWVPPWSSVSCDWRSWSAKVSGNIGKTTSSIIHAVLPLP